MRAIRLGLLCLVACASSSAPPARVAEPPGAMMGTHGMTLFGGGGALDLYLSHIPLYEAPHAKQLVLQVGIASGVPADGLAQFETNNFTIEPERMSLADLVAGRLTRFKATIYFGNFESGGKALYPNVVFDVKRVVFERALSPALPRASKLEYVAIGHHLVHVVDAPPSFDNVVAITSSEPLGDGTFITGGPNDIAQRLALPSTITVTRELGCLPGPEFAGTCPAL